MFDFNNKTLNELECTFPVAQVQLNYHHHLLPNAQILLTLKISFLFCTIPFFRQNRTFPLEQLVETLKWAQYDCAETSIVLC